MSSIRFDVEYSLNEYFTLVSIVELAISKYDNFDITDLLLLPIRLPVLLLSLIIALLNLPFF